MLFGSTVCSFFSTDYEFRHTALLRYYFVHILWILTCSSFGVLFFSHTMNSDIRLFRRTVFSSAYHEFGHTALLMYCLFPTCYEFGHTVFFSKYYEFFWTYCSYGELFFHILWIRTCCSFDVLFFFVEILWMQTYCYFSILLISWTYCSFGILLFHMLWIRTYCFFHALWIFGHIVLLVYCFSHIMNSEILLFWTQHQISLDSAI